VVGVVVVGVGVVGVVGVGVGETVAVAGTTCQVPPKLWIPWPPA